MRVTIVSGGNGDLEMATCLVCGMHWTAHENEGCPRCGLAVSLERIEEARRQFDLLAGYAR